MGKVESFLGGFPDDGHPMFTGPFGQPHISPDAPASQQAPVEPPALPPALPAASASQPDDVIRLPPVPLVVMPAGAPSEKDGSELFSSRLVGWIFRRQNLFLDK